MQKLNPLKSVSGCVSGPFRMRANSLSRPRRCLGKIGLAKEEGTTSLGRKLPRVLLGSHFKERNRAWHPLEIQK